MTLKFYNAVVCPFAQRTKLTLLEKQVEFEEITIDLGNKPSWFHDVSPYGKVPAILHNDKSIYESNIINEYIDDVFPDNPLISKDPYLKAQMRIWMAFCGDAIIPNHYGLLRSQDTEKQNEMRIQLIKKLELLETVFTQYGNEGPFLFGNDISLVDITFYPFVRRFCVLKHYRDFDVPEHCEHFLNWIATMEKRDSVQQSSENDDFYIDAYRKYAVPTK